MIVLKNQTNKRMFLMQAKHVAKELISLGWQQKQACSVCKALF
jgi:hypothetical protein